MELQQVNQMIIETSHRINKATMTIHKMAREKAETEYTYRIAISKEITRLKAEGMAISILYDVAKGNVADELLQRDLAEGKFKAAIESLRALQSELSGLQSILRHQEEVEAGTGQ